VFILPSSYAVQLLYTSLYLFITHHSFISLIFKFYITIRMYLFSLYASISAYMFVYYILCEFL